MDTMDNSKDARLEVASITAKKSSTSLQDEVNIRGSPGQVLYREYLTGWRLNVLTLWYVLITETSDFDYTSLLNMSNSICLSIFLPNLEVSIVSTALVDITNDLHGFSQTGWVITIISADVALATALGPILGGLITENTTWRWVFILKSVPAGIVAMILLFLSMPPGFPNHGNSSEGQPGLNPKLSLAPFLRIDALGTLLLLGTSFLFVTSLLETSTKFSWGSSTTISLLVLSGVFLIGFLFWERHITISSSQQEPIFPWRFVHNRAWMGMLFVSLLLGIPFTVLVVNIPQKFQTVKGLSPLQAGIRLLPYALIAPIGSFMANGIISKAKKFPPVFLVLIGAVLQVLGLALYSGLDTGIYIKKSQYGFQAIAGFGLGISFGTLVLMTPFSVDPQDLATGTGAMVQFRQLGSAIGLSVAQSLMNSQLTSKLSSILTREQLVALLETTTSVNRFPSELRIRVIDVFSGAYGLQIKVVTAFAAAEILAALLILKREQTRVG
ncbi:hypothetical protein NHQ30_003888 [Ciborinia camelliae]|nr:hypothetical protein NHQ30_003888 [Ciborinia camelliae]